MGVLLTETFRVRFLLQEHMILVDMGAPVTTTLCRSSITVAVSLVSLEDAAKMVRVLYFMLHSH